MYHYAKGHTLETVMAAIKKGNKNRIATSPHRANCQYLTVDGNRCFIGCFIPEGHLGFAVPGPVNELLSEFSDLRRLMPIEELDGLREFQSLHDDPDNRNDQNDLYDLAEHWLRKM